ncbi:Ribonuclease H1 [Allomyces arbusculus]|nr:Ribonuclease H1 [Allomyces arbusculus]
MAKAKKSFYVVVRGRKPGLYRSWPECQMQTAGFSNAKFQGFASQYEAAEYMRANGLEGTAAATRSSAGPRSRTAEPGLGVQGGPRFKPEPGSRKPPHAPSSSSTSRNHGANLNGAGTAAIAQDLLRRFTPVRVDTPASDNVTVVYTDGSCQGPAGRRRGGIGAWFGRGDPRNISLPLRILETSANAASLHSNQKAEIQAVTEVLRTVSPFENLLIRTDSQYVINAMTSWIVKWRKNGYKDSQQRDVQNTLYFKELDAAMQAHHGQIKFEYCPGHAGVEGNEAADRLAKQGTLQ